MKTITITQGAPRLTTIQDQFGYALEHLTNLSADSIRTFKHEIKCIYEISFYGLLGKTNRSPKHPLVLIFDWEEHEKLLKSNPSIDRNDQWKNGVNPDVYKYVNEFATYCAKQGLSMDFTLKYSAIGKQNELEVDKKLGLKTMSESENIQIDNEDSVQHPIWGIDEMSIRRPI